MTLATIASIYKLISLKQHSQFFTAQLQLLHQLRHIVLLDQAHLPKLFVHLDIIVLRVLKHQLLAQLVHSVVILDW